MNQERDEAEIDDRKGEAEYEFRIEMDEILPAFGSDQVSNPIFEVSWEARLSARRFDFQCQGWVFADVRRDAAESNRVPECQPCWQRKSDRVIEKVECRRERPEVC